VSFPDDRRYSKEHEWIRAEGSEAVIGLTQFAVTELGDIVYVELPAVGSTMTQFAPFGVVESVKAVSDLFAPASGSVVAVNEELRAKPELLNSDPHGEGWVCRIALTSPTELEGLLDASAYAALTGGP
jgi:glycine cleavage system H protein